MYNGGIMKKPKVVVVSGGFDPLHSGHIAMFKAARQLGDYLVVAVNSDEWLTRKKGRSFMPLSERMEIISNLYMVTDRIAIDDSDGTAKDAIYQAQTIFPNSEIIFANGGDRTSENIPEMLLLKLMSDNLSFVFGVGGTEKKNSSSSILADWHTQRTERDWGYWRVLDDKKTVKVKELVIMPGKSLSNQRHEFRNETWHVIKGECKIQFDHQFDDIEFTTTATMGDINIIPIMAWHRPYNDTDEPCHIIEIQSGDQCTEEDIERK
jgi:cytidyltransferase-like protein